MEAREAAGALLDADAALAQAPALAGEVIRLEQSVQSDFLERS